LLGAGGFWGARTGPNPTDRGKAGSKRHLLTDANGLPLAIEHTAANVHDSRLCLPLVEAVPPIQGPRGRPRRRPDILFADRAYSSAAIRRALRACGVLPAIAKPGDAHGSGLGAYRCVIEGAFAWLFGWRRLRVRYEKRADIHDAFLRLACAMICFRRWQRHAGFC
jgi:transposase